MSDVRVQAIQEALIKKGYIPGEVDGVWGRRTIAAVKLFQKRMGLDVDGVVGPMTRAALLDSDVTATSPAATMTSFSPVLPWMAEARNLLGVREIDGIPSNPEILDWAKDLDIAYSDDDIPWCGLFVGHCIGASMPDEVLPKNPLGARQWERFGIRVEPRYGAVMVFWRGSRTGGKGHVGFYAGEDEDAYYLLGGNQSNKVSYAWVGKNRFLQARWPGTAGTLGGGAGTIRVVRGMEQLSTQEA